MDTQLEILRESFVELVVGIFILGQVVEHLDTLLDKVLLDDSQNLVLLEGFTRDVQWQILGIDNTLDKLEPLRHKLFAVVHDEDTTDIQLDVVPLLLGTALEHVERGPLGCEKDSFEFELTFDREVFDSCVFFPVIGHGLIERHVLVMGHLVRLSHPDGLGVVQVLPLVAHFFDLLRLLFFLGFFFVIYLFNLGLFGIFFFVFILLVVGDLLFGRLFSVQHDGESNELGVLLHKVFDALLFQVLRHVFLQVEDDASSTFQAGIGSVGDGERSTGFGGPHVAGVIVVLGDDLDPVGHQVGRVETDAKLSNHGDIRTGRQGFHKGLGTRLGNGTQVVDQVGLGHTDTGIFNGESVVGLVGNKLDLKFRISIEDGWIGQRLVSNLIQCIGGVGDEFTQKDLLVGVKGVDDQRKKLVDISRECVAFGFSRHCSRCLVLLVVMQGTSVRKEWVWLLY
mmetsp:Transcript_32551/g.54503  ORF Transcript_32551/g.54503 Transcript_32551/m.54503 type:complete len:452 (-) Transcript_32551:35-1390(-)